jgi:hypothetical protein
MNPPFENDYQLPLTIQISYSSLKCSHNCADPGARTSTVVRCVRSKTSENSPGATVTAWNDKSGQTTTTLVFSAGAIRKLFEWISDVFILRTNQSLRR